MNKWVICREAIFIFSIIMLSCSCDEENDLHLYNTNDTSVYISFDGNYDDMSRYKHKVTVAGSLNYMKGHDESANSAAFFDGEKNILSFELLKHNGIEISFWFAPYTVRNGITIFDYMNSLLSIAITNVDIQYVDAYSTATYTVSALHNSQNRLSRQLEVKPYPVDITFFNNHTIWQEVKIRLGFKEECELILNNNPVGKFNFDYPPPNIQKARIYIGTSKSKDTFFRGKIDELIIKNYMSDK